MSDIEPRLPLAPLDPGHDDPGYWGRFHGRVMGAAASRLQARARTARLTIEDMLLSWSRMVVPGAAAAAALAGFLFLAEPAPHDGEVLLGVEDLLRLEAERGGVPTFLTANAPLDREQFLVAIEGDPGDER
jgi:hypothetical protein